MIIFNEKMLTNQFIIDICKNDSIPTGSCGHCDKEAERYVYNGAFCAQVCNECHNDLDDKIYESFMSFFDKDKKGE